MSMDSILYGYIRCPRDLKVEQHNRSVLDGLPVYADKWPFITRTMFCMAPIEGIDGGVFGTPQFNQQVIGIGASYKHMWPCIEAEFLDKFEELLAKLIWWDAMLYNDLEIRYIWKVNHDYSLPYKISTKWSFRCEKVTGEVLGFDDAIEGDFSSNYHEE